MDKSKNHEKNIYGILKYYGIFDHAPTFTEIHNLYPAKISEIDLEIELKKLLKSKGIELLGKYYHILGGVYNEFKINEKRMSAYRKLEMVRKFTKIFRYIPGVVYVGVSGSVGAGYASSNDDIDLFVITKKNRIYTTRLALLVFFRLIGILRTRKSKDNKNKFCFNLFFDESDISLPIQKRGVYGAFELFSLKTIYDARGAYGELLAHNDWAQKILPNYQVQNMISPLIQSKDTNQLICKIADYIENICSIFQVFFIQRHKTTELITATQLWFHPNDISQKINKEFGL